MDGVRFLLFTIVWGSAYAYYLFKAHFLAVKLDRSVGLPRSGCGEIRIDDLRSFKASAPCGEYAADAQAAILSLRAGNLIAISYLLGVAMVAIAGQAG